MCFHSLFPKDESFNPDLTLVVSKHDRDGLVSWREEYETKGVKADSKASIMQAHPARVILRTGWGFYERNLTLRLNFSSSVAAQASTIFFGSIASLSTCSSMIFPSFPIRKFTRRGA